MKDHTNATEERILHSAMQLFAERGYDAVSTKEICKSAGANVSALHYYFKTKEDLYKYILSSFTKKIYNEAVLRILRVPETFEELRVRLEMFYEELLELVLQHVEIGRILRFEKNIDSQRSKEIWQYFHPLIEALNCFFASAIENNIIDQKLNPRWISLVFIKLIEFDYEVGSYHQNFFDIDFKVAEERQKFVKFIIKLFLHGLK